MIKDYLLMKMSKKKDDKKKQVYQAKWDENISESSSDNTSNAEEAVNMCFIATDMRYLN